MKFPDFFTGSALGVIAFASLVPSANAADSNSGATGEEPLIIVTAQKRNTELQRTPAAVAVITADQLESRGVTSLETIAFQTPGVAATGAGAEYQMVVRGIGPASSAAGYDVPVGFLVDGIDTSRYMTMVGLIDVAQVEILPGPQGTLYGGVSAGGTINVATRNPGKDFGIDGFLEVGNYASHHLRVGVDLPINNGLQMRAVYDRDYHDGYLSSGLQDLKQNTGRVTLAFQPTDNFSGHIKATYSHLGGRAMSFPTSPPIDSGNPWLVTDDPRLSFAASDSGIGHMTVEQLDGLSQALLGRPLSFPSELEKFRDEYYTRQEIVMLSGRFDLELGDLTLSYLPGYQHLSRRFVAPIANDGLLDITNAPLTPTWIRFPQFNDRYVQELRLSNRTGAKLEWLLGGYYSHDKTSTGIFYGVIYDSITVKPVVTDSYAAFGQATYSLTDAFRLTGGLRYSHDRKKGTFSGTRLPTVVIALGACTDPDSGVLDPVCAASFASIPDYTLPGGTIQASKSWDRLDYKAGLEYDITDDNHLYATVQSGYMRGGISYDGSTLDPVKLTSFSLGSKNQFLDRKLTLNLEAFYYDYRDLQVVFTNSSGVTRGYNVPKSRVYGVEASASMRLGPDTEVHASATLLSAKYVHFDLGPSLGLADLSGLRLQAAPKASVNLGASHTFHLGDYKLVASTDHHLESGSWRTFDHGLLSSTPLGMYKKSYWIGNASLALMQDDESWSIGAYIRNIGDEDAGAAVLSGEVNHAQRGTPRTYGVRASFNF